MDSNDGDYIDHDSNLNSYNSMAKDVQHLSEMHFYNAESSEDDLSEKQNGMPTKKTKGRVKIKMEFIDNKLRRYTTFSKRKTGIMKKAYELSTLTGTQVMLLVASETGHVYTFATRKLQPMITSESGKALIQTCLNSPDNPSFGLTATLPSSSSSNHHPQTDLAHPSAATSCESVITSTYGDDYEADCKVSTLFFGSSGAATAAAARPPASHEPIGRDNFYPLPEEYPVGVDYDDDDEEEDDADVDRNASCRRGPGSSGNAYPVPTARQRRRRAPSARDCATAVDDDGTRWGRKRARTNRPAPTAHYDDETTSISPTGMTPTYDEVMGKGMLLYPTNDDTNHDDVTFGHGSQNARQCQPAFPDPGYERTSDNRHRSQFGPFTVDPNGGDDDIEYNVHPPPLYRSSSPSHKSRGQGCMSAALGADATAMAPDIFGGSIVVTAKRAPHPSTAPKIHNLQGNGHRTPSSVLTGGANVNAIADAITNSIKAAAALNDPSSHRLNSVPPSTRAPTPSTPNKGHLPPNLQFSYNGRNGITEIKDRSQSHVKIEDFGPVERCSLNDHTSDGATSPTPKNDHKSVQTHRDPSFNHQRQHSTFQTAIQAAQNNTVTFHVSPSQNGLLHNNLVIKLTNNSGPNPSSLLPPTDHNLSASSPSQQIPADALITKDGNLILNLAHFLPPNGRLLHPNQSTYNENEGDKDISVPLDKRDPLFLASS